MSHFSEVDPMQKDIAIPVERLQKYADAARHWAI